MASSNPDELLSDDMGAFYDDPLGFVLYAYDWDNDPELQVCELPEPWSLIYPNRYGPDEWACRMLDRIGDEVRARGFDRVHAVAPIQMATASGHGIGKSALVAWIADWIMSTRPHARGVVTANTSEQLSSKTWAEITKWTKRCITGHWFEITTGRGSMRMYHHQHPESWKLDAQTCREENSESFAGQHAVTSTPFYLFDEASAVPDKIWEVSEGGLTDGEPMWFVFGNPTRNSGRFKDCFGRFRHRWITQQIDSREVQITNKKKIQEWIDDHGVDSDFVKVRVRGIFPSLSITQFISTADVDAALGRKLREQQYNFASKIICVDPAWQGDDEFVIGLRQGLAYRQLVIGRKNDNDVHMANVIARLEDEHEADGVIIDFGYGTGIYSAGKTMGRDWLLCNFASESGDIGCLNKRAEIYKLMRDWLKAGGAIENDPILQAELSSVETVPRMDGKIQIESKEDMKRRGLSSPNRADALAISFAYPVEKKQRNPLLARYKKTTGREYDPLAGARVQSTSARTYDPLALANR